jgi:hypothetical protein
VVITSLISVSPISNLPGVSFLRTVRVFRPLRTMTRIKGMQPLMSTLYRSFQRLADIFALLLFFFVLFGILGIELLNTSLRGRCYVDPTQDMPSYVKTRLFSQQIPYRISFSAGDVCPQNGEIETALMNPCDPVIIDNVELTTVCSPVKWCNTQWCESDFNDNPLDFGAGYISYDNFGEAFLSLTQSLTNEGWVDIMYLFEVGAEKWGSRFFHIMWVLLGSFFVMQLALAVLADSFVQAQEAERTEKEREALHSEAILFAKVDEEPEGHGLSPGMDPSRSMYGRLKKRLSMDGVQLPVSGLQLPTIHVKQDSMLTLWFGKVVHVYNIAKGASERLVQTSWFQNFILVCIVANTVTMMLTYHDQPLFEDNICRRRCDLDPQLPSAAREHCTGPLFDRAFVSDGRGGRMRPTQEAFCYLQGDAEVELPTASRYHGANCSRHSDRESCNSDRGVTGVGCYWFIDHAWFWEMDGPRTRVDRRVPDHSFIDGRLAWYRDGKLDEEKWNSTHAYKLELPPGDCRLGLYSAEQFAEKAELAGGTQKISFRHLCGDGKRDLCPTFSPSKQNVLESINLVLTVVFIFEAGFKLFGLGLSLYFADSFNIFDFVIVAVSIFELVVGSSGGGSSVSALRGMRLFRLFKLARGLKRMRQILHTLAVALGSMGSLILVWVMFMYIFALLSISVFAGKFRMVKTSSPRSNFDMFFPSIHGHGALFVVFQMISTENWNTIMYNSITAEQPFSPPLAFVSIAVVYFGNYIVMNLFISILLQGFGDDEEEDEGMNEGSQDGEGRPQPESLKERMMAGFRRLLRGARGGSAQSAGDPRVSETPAGLFKATPAAGILSRENLAVFEEAIGEEGPTDSEAHLYMHVRGFKGKIKVPHGRSFFVLHRTNPVRMYCAALVQHPVFENLILLCIIVTTVTLLFERPDDTIITDACPRAPSYLNCSGLGVGHVDSINCPNNAGDENFGQVYRPCGPDDGSGRPEPSCCFSQLRSDAFATTDKIFTLIFLVEMVLKWVSDGLILHENSYLRDSWNWLDFIIVLISMISSFSSSSSVGFLKSLRAVRTLRPLRVIKRSPGLRVAVTCLLSSIPQMINVMVVVIMWFSLWGMFGVEFFKGQFWSCFDPVSHDSYGAAVPQDGPLYDPTPVLTGADAVPTIVECVNAGGGGVGVWKNLPYSFDSYPEGLLTLFEMATTEGWMGVMAATMDIMGPGITPIPNNKYYLSLYSVIHLIIGAFVLLNLLVGSVINTYNKIKAQNDGIGPFITPEQQEWKETQRLIMQLKPKRRIEPPKNKLRARLFRICQSDAFEITVTSFIFLNVVFMTFRLHHMTDCYRAFIFYSNCVFTTIFVIEATIKILGLGLKWYFYDWWNLFDFVIVLLSVGITILDILGKEYACGFDRTGAIGKIPGINLLRALRIARVLRLVRRFKGLRQMIETLIVSLPSLVNIGLLLIIIMTIFSVLAQNLFFNINQDQDGGGNLSDVANYVYFDNAFFMLFRQTTGEAWNAVMYYTSEEDLYLACARSELAFLENMPQGCGHPAVGRPFHVLWQVIGTYILMQLFTAVILENFHELAAGDANSTVPAEKLQEFVFVWNKLDPEAEERIDVEQLGELISQLPPPLGLKGKLVTRNALMQVIKDLQIPIHGNKIRYNETFVAFVRRCLTGDMQDEDDDIVDDVSRAESEVIHVDGTFRGVPHSSHLAPLFDRIVVTPLNLAREIRSAEHYSWCAGRRITAAEDFAARAVQKAYRDWREQKIQVHKGTAWTTKLPLHGLMVRGMESPIQNGHAGRGNGHRASSPVLPAGISPPKEPLASTAVASSRVASPSAPQVSAEKHVETASSAEPASNDPASSAAPQEEAPAATPVAPEAATAAAPPPQDAPAAGEAQDGAQSASEDASAGETAAAAAGSSGEQSEEASDKRLADAPADAVEADAVEANAVEADAVEGQGAPPPAVESAAADTQEAQPAAASPGGGPADAEAGEK